MKERTVFPEFALPVRDKVCTLQVWAGKRWRVS